MDEEIDFEGGGKHHQRHDGDRAVGVTREHNPGEDAPGRQSAQNCIKSHRTALANGGPERFVFGLAKVTHALLSWVSNDILPIFSPLGIFFLCDLSRLC